MTHDDESDQIRALLREAHRGDERCPPFRKSASESGARRPASRNARALHAAALAFAAIASAIGVLVLRRERPPPTSPLGPLASSWRALEAPLDFLLELPRPPPLEAFPSLRVLPQTKRR